jgi:NADH-quinone oxidoreductase subunit M
MTTKIAPLTVNFGIDGLSLFFVILTTYITPLCLLLSFNRVDNEVSDKIRYGITMLILELFLIVCFTSLDLFTFFFFFEAILLPMIFLIGY